MTNHYPSTNNARANNGNFDWTSFIASAMFEGGQEFLKTIGSAPKTLDETELTQAENQIDQRVAKAFVNAKRARTNPGPQLLSAIRNWSRKQAIAILCEKAAGKPINRDFYQPFQLDLHQEIAAMIDDLQLFWEQEDERQAAVAMQQAAAKREETEQAFLGAYPLIRGLNDVVLNSEQERRSIFESGQQAAQGWANKYEESVKTREQWLEEREKRIQQQEQENREHQLALRSLTKWDDRNSFANTLVSTGKNTTGCLLIWVLLVVGILLAIYLAFPHH